MNRYENHIDHRRNMCRAPKPLKPASRPPSSVLRLLSSVLCLSLAGCSGQQQNVQAEPICLANVRQSQAMQIAEEVLAKMNFTIEKADAERGLITTRPLAGAQFFELWRSDNVGAFNAAEANLHSLRRTVALNIGPDSQQGKKLCLSCEVTVQRLSLPEYHVSSSSRAYQMFTESTSSMQSLRFNPEQRAAMEWIDLDDDQSLAEEILKRIEQRIKREE